jgi:hypothetical protein
MQDLLALLRTTRWSRRGAILPLFAITFALLLLFLGLVVDGGMIYFERRRAQAAADAGAYGGALELLHNNDVWVDDAGKADAKMNGFDDDDADIVVTVNNPPLTGSAAGDNNAVEVIVQSTVATTLMQLAANDHSIVRARAVAAVGPDWGPLCILSLNETITDAITFSGTVDMYVPDCEIIARSNDPQAIEFNGGPCITAAAIGYGTGGGYDGTTSSNSCIDPEPIGIIPPEDPYANLPEPVLAEHVVRATSRTSRTSSDGAETFLPGIYEGGIKISGGGPYTFAPGTYIIDGMNISGGTLYGHGVTFFNTGDGLRNISITGGTHVELSAPNGTGGDYDNILFYNDRDIETGKNPYDVKISGDSTSTFEGVLYFPSVEVEFGGNQDTTLDVFTQIIGDTINLHGTAQVSGNYGYANPDRIPTTNRVSFVE